MITKEKFRLIKEKVESSVDEMFEMAKQNEVNKNDYILFLANAENINKYHEYGENPHILDYRIFKLIDFDRRKFLLDYLNNSYSFNQEETIDSKNSLTLELMIYSHIWESKPFLRQLKKIANLCQSSDYNWLVEVPDYTKHTFIREELRDVFKVCDLNISEIITKGYHSSLRNAFSHSEYYFDHHELEKIHLTNSQGKEWEISELTFNEWTERFCYSFLLSHYFQNKFELERESLIHNKPYPVNLKNRDGHNIDGIIQYDSERKSYQGTII
ncbi:MAG: hypothetical protein GQ540_02030 [Lutibacter sp.]|uniref:hypothetical protein n=1 Tax=Lutibacter sp. TaxID=1925666 RepID=UPI0019F55DFA|nr:hypothetical protein [Lutibacter sp.]NOR27286.1 hypothetical protein [Lutibacter sp.]